MVALQYAWVISDNSGVINVCLNVWSAIQHYNRQIDKYPILAERIYQDHVQVAIVRDYNGPTNRITMTRVVVSN